MEDRNSPCSLSEAMVSDQLPMELPSPAMFLELYDRLEKTMVELENSKLEASEESRRRHKAEKEALEASRHVNYVQRLYLDELKKRTETCTELIEMKKDFEFTNSLLEKVTQELHEASEQKLSLESQLEKTYLSEKELEKKILSAVDLLQKWKNYHNELEEERDRALQEAEELRYQLAQHSQRPLRSHASNFDFSFAELHEATNNFDSALIIEEGEKGTTYKGVLHHIDVAITMLNPNTISGPREFEQEVYMLSKLRHPNIVTLIGICSDPLALVFEYLSRGSLEDRLMRKDNTPPLPWKTRIEIAKQLCSILTFLHSRSPSSIIHGNLKPENILLNEKFVCKLHGFCLDLKFPETEELTPAANVYSFGIILLCLLTGKIAFGLANDVKDALDSDDLSVILDKSAGNLPNVQAKRLASMALRCCDMDPNVRPDLNSEVWNVLESIKASSQPLSRLPLESEEEVPHHFICPISLDIMEDPRVAADGFTYEAKAIEEWLKNYKNSSPMTSEKVANKVLIHNHALRSAIQDWLERCRSA